MERFTKTGGHGRLPGSPHPERNSIPLTPPPGATVDRDGCTSGNLENEALLIMSLIIFHPPPSVWIDTSRNEVKCTLMPGRFTRAIQARIERA